MASTGSDNELVLGRVSARQAYDLAAERGLEAALKRVDRTRLQKFRSEFIPEYAQFLTRDRQCFLQRAAEERGQYRASQSNMRAFLEEGGGRLGWKVMIDANRPNVCRHTRKDGTSFETRRPKSFVPGSKSFVAALDHVRTGDRESRAPSMSSSGRAQGPT